MDQEATWEFSGESCRDLEHCLSLIKQTDEDEGNFIICSRGEKYMQAAGKGEGPYTLEVRTSGPNNYQHPEGVSWEELVVYMDRFSKGDDFEDAADSWIELKSSPQWGLHILFALAGLILLMFFLWKSGIFKH